MIGIDFKGIFYLLIFLHPQRKYYLRTLISKVNMDIIQSKYSFKFFFLYPLFFILNTVFLCGLVYLLFREEGIVFKGYFDQVVFDRMALVFLLLLFGCTQYYLISNCKSLTISDREIKITPLFGQPWHMAKEEVYIQEGRENIQHNPQTRIFMVISKQTKKQHKFREFEYRNYDKLRSFLRSQTYDFEPEQGVDQV